MRPLDWQLNTQYHNPQEYLRNLPLLLDGDNRDELWRQLDRAGLYNPVPPGTKFSFNADESLTYEGLPPLAPAAFAFHGLERIYVYPTGWIVILQLNGSYSLTRM